MLKSYGADLSAINYDLRTALHVAASEGNADVVKHLLLNGAAIHIKDRYDRTPLQEAISNDHHEIIKLLMKCGGHITGSSRSVGESLCGASSRGMIRRLEGYRLAGADLSLQDCSGRTALHLAALHGNLDVAEYLLKHQVDIDLQDMLGLTALNYAEKGRQSAIIDLLLPSFSQNGVNGSSLKNSNVMNKTNGN